ncbi:flagellar export chaperone FliS [Cellulomonas edaphi]|uniref:Flagellar export chaperone FliS n=1 Tax=Cellulomonas edaphi TaxID=3053468 RepID=A0ABT7S4I6_9CELL|nr:flagellar export chaperone FliS [Cellulomons edaphi]MDM7830538.1 flagellar export chaperone FliS [Cellulomons edaphi]
MIDARSRYVTDAVSTVGPARLLTMLYDRLLLDLDRGCSALVMGDRLTGASHLQHAQDIVAELMSSLDERVWDGGEQLMAIYRYLFTTLVDAGVQGDSEKVAECRDMVEPLRAAWHAAAQAVSVSAPQTTAATDAHGAGLLGVG